MGPLTVFFLVALHLKGHFTVLVSCFLANSAFPALSKHLKRDSLRYSELLHKAFQWRASAQTNSDCSGACADLLVLVHGPVVTDCSGICTDLTHVCSIYVRLCCQSAWLGYLITLCHEKKKSLQVSKLDFNARSAAHLWILKFRQPHRITWGQTAHLNFSSPVQNTNGKSQANRWSTASDNSNKHVSIPTFHPSATNVKYRYPHFTQLQPS